MAEVAADSEVAFFDTTLDALNLVDNLVIRFRRNLLTNGNRKFKVCLLYDKEFVRRRWPFDREHSDYNHMLDQKVFQTLQALGFIVEYNYTNYIITLTIKREEIQLYDPIQQ